MDFFMFSKSNVIGK